MSVNGFSPDELVAEEELLNDSRELAFRLVELVGDSLSKHEDPRLISMLMIVAARRAVDSLLAGAGAVFSALGTPDGQALLARLHACVMGAFKDFEDGLNSLEREPHDSH